MVTEKTIGSVLEAGSDTTSAALYSFVLAMVLHPEVQQKAHEELDREFADSLPGYEDIASLPYIRSVMKETLRWLGPMPLGAVPHAVTQDDVYMVRYPLTYAEFAS